MKVLFGMLVLGVPLLVLTPSTALGAQGQWALTASTSIGHGQTAWTQLLDGRVLVAGGHNLIGTTEIYDPATSSWTTTGSLNVARSESKAVTLNDGRVLLTGGITAPGANGLTTTELYDPATGTWTLTGNMIQGRTQFSLIKLLDGRVLAATGQTGFGPTFTSQSEVYDPATGQWSPAGSVVNVVADSVGGNHAVLPDGRVLLIGSALFTRSETSQLYNPATGQWTQTGNLLVPRHSARLVMLPSGKVLIIGGSDWGSFLANAELFDPATEQWTATGSLGTPRDSHAVLLPNGTVLVTGGYYQGPLASSEIYDPVTETWTPDTASNVEHNGGLLAVLPNGKVLLAGGYDTNGLTTASELYTPGQPTAPVYHIGTNAKATSTNRAIATTAVAVPAGDTITVAVATGTFAGAVGCSDTKGNTYSVVADKNTGNGRLFVCAALAATALTSSDIISATYPGFSGLSLISANAISSTVSNGLIDQTSVGSGNNTQPNSGNVSTTSPHELILGFIAHNSVPTLSPGAGFTAVGAISAGSGSGRKTLSPEFETVTAAGNYAAEGTLNTGQQWRAAVVTFQMP